MCAKRTNASHGLSIGECGFALAAKPRFPPQNEKPQGLEIETWGFQIHRQQRGSGAESARFFQQAERQIPPLDHIARDFQVANALVVG
jgi:hypothetical protein